MANIAGNPLDPEERSEDLIAHVDTLEKGFTSEFADWDAQHYPSAEDYFEWTYAEIIRTLHLIEEEKFKNNANQPLKSKYEALWARAVGLLGRSVDHVKKVDVGLRPVHKRLLADMLRLASTQYTSGANGLSMHLISMGNQLHQIWPPAREAWVEDGTDLKPDEDFERLYEAFSSLQDIGSYDLYVKNSWIHLNMACRALHIPEHKSLPDPDFFRNETRPTYVDYSCTSEEFLYGKGDRPGILSVKKILGGPLTAEEHGNIKEAAKKREKKRGNKRRAGKQAGREERGPKRARTQAGYTMTRLNAAADVENILRDSKYPGIDTPDAARIITPTCKNRENMLGAYRKDLRRIANAIYKVKFGLPTTTAKLPQTPAQRTTWLQSAATEINSTRAMVNIYIGSINSPAKAKQLRLAAYRLKLARAMYTLGLLSGEPSASPAEIRDGLQARLDDWILHEQAFNAADRFQLSSRMKQATADTLRANIQERDDNITRWREMRGDLGNQPAPNKNNHRGNGGNEAPPADDDNDGEDDDDANTADEGGEDEEGIPWLTDEEIERATIMLNGVLIPRKPKSSNWLPIYKDVTDPFAAGGPPNHDQLPLGSVWERLQYMWVITHWRFYQLRHLEFDDDDGDEGA
jgi:hypothetical protein